MSQPTLILSFPDASPAEAERLTRQMATMLREELPDLRFETARSNPDSQAGESVLLLFADGFAHAVKTETAIVAGVAVGKVVFDALVRIGSILLARMNATNLHTQQVTQLSSAHASVSEPGKSQGPIEA